MHRHHYVFPRHSENGYLVGTCACGATQRCPVVPRYLRMPYKPHKFRFQDLMDDMYEAQLRKALLEPR